MSYWFGVQGSFAIAELEPSRRLLSQKSLSKFNDVLFPKNNLKFKQMSSFVNRPS